jgi:alginate O-acetyltransferase complex protein AlgI
VFADPWFWAYLAGAVVVHWLLPLAARGWWIAGASTAYLVTQGTRHEGLWGVAGALAASLAVWAVAPRLTGPAPKRVLFAVLLALVGFLAAFKYLPPLLRALWPEDALASVVLPLGISYFVFKLIHYAVETSRGNVKERSLGTFLSWMLLAPIFTAGPIERFDHFVRERETRWSGRFAVEGLTRVVHGLVKKFLVADWLVQDLLNSGRTPRSVVAALDATSGRDARLFLVCVFLYAYFDFAGYSDLAIGTSRLFGLRIQENFDAPLLARNLSTFWKKWHMTLAGWCQSYVYMPALGITRNPYVAVVATFVVMGLWHAANLNYVAWGLWQAAGVCVALTWTRWRMRRGFRPATSGWRSWWGIPVTLAFFTLGLTFSATYELGIGAALRLGARAVGLRVDA